MVFKGKIHRDETALLVETHILYRFGLNPAPEPALARCGSISPALYHKMI